MSNDLNDGAWGSPEGEYVHGSIPKRSARNAEAKKRLRSFFDEPVDEAPLKEEDGGEGLYRCEIVANNSVQDDIVELLETACPDILYTILPSVYGRGKNDRKLQSATWPETNFVLFAYVTRDKLSAIKRAVRAVKETFHGEGIKLFIMKGCLPEDL